MGEFFLLDPGKPGQAKIKFNQINQALSIL